MDKKVLLINNTEKYHSGSKQVINYFRENIIDLSIAKTLKNIDVKKYDLIILNGEGTMHSDNKKMNRFLDFLIYASKKGTKTAMVNSVWQNNSEKTTKKLESIDYVSVREVKSKKEIQKYSDVRVDIYLDLSYYSKIFPFVPTHNPKKKYNIVAGNRFSEENDKIIAGLNEDCRIDIFSQNWNQLINILKESKLLITGRHHEMYAACKAKCPFIVLEGNTHKNSGLLETFNVKVPVLSRYATQYEIIKTIETYNTKEFEKLFKSMSNYPVPNFYEKIF